MRKILYVSKTKNPEDAAGLRINSIAFILEKLGFSVDVISESITPQALTTNASDTGGLFENEQIVYYRTVRYFFQKPQKIFKFKILYTISNILELIFANHIFVRVKKHILSDNPEYIFIYNQSYYLTKKLIHYCQNRRIKIIGDVTEWYEKKEDIKHLIDIIIPKSVDKRITCLDNQLSGIVAISPYLYDYYRNIGQSVCFIPPLMESFCEPKINNKKLLSLVYAGSPGEKDLLLPVINAILKINTSGDRKIHLTLIGINTEDIGHMIGNNYNTHFIEAKGRLQHDKCIDIISESDCSFLIRRPLRYAKAGFSTKFAEAMSLGVPMICNKVGGCDSFVDDRNDGFLIDAYDENSIVNVLEEVSDLKENGQLVQIKKNAYNKAKDLFGMNRYIVDLSNLLFDNGTIR